MIGLEIDIGAFERRAREMSASLDQLPFAIANSMNAAAVETRQEIISDVWPKAVTVRNRSFMRAALRVEFASKASLSVSIYDTLGRAHLAKHARGGTKQGKGRLAIPARDIPRGASGVRQSMRPMNLKRAVVKGGMIFQAVGRGKNSRLKLIYKLAPSAVIKKNVPFLEEFRARMLAKIDKGFPLALAKAMATRRR